MPDGEFTNLVLVQPSARRREWELRRGEDVEAVLRVPVFRSGARAEISSSRLRIERQGRLRADYAVVDETTGDEVASLRRHGRRRVLELGDRTAEWKRLGHKQGFGFVDPDGEPFLRANVRSGLVRSSGEVKIDMRLPDREATVAAILATYLLIRRNEEAAAGATASTSAAASS